MPIEFFVFITIFTLIAAVCDIRNLKVPNRLIIVGLICYILLAIIMVRFNKILSFSLLQYVLTGIIISSIIFLTPYILGKICHKQFLGAGDVKIGLLTGCCMETNEFLVFTGFLVVFALVGFCVKGRFNKNRDDKKSAFVPYMFLSVFLTLILRLLEVV